MPLPIRIRESLAGALPALVLAATVLAAGLLWRNLLFVAVAEHDKSEPPQVPFASTPAGASQSPTLPQESSRNRSAGEVINLTSGLAKVTIATNATQRIVQGGQATR